MGDLAAGHSYGGKSLRRPSDRSPGANIARTYRQAAQLYLTRRLPEALSTLKPIISPRLGSGKHRDDADGADAKEADAAAIASSSRASRVKVWSFYLTLLHSVVELGPEEGKEAFGSAPWRAVVGKVRDGSVWEDVVRLGYAGDEASVDGEVVINL